MKRTFMMPLTIKQLAKLERPPYLDKLEIEYRGKRRVIHEIIELEDGQFQVKMRSLHQHNCLTYDLEPTTTILLDIFHKYAIFSYESIFRVFGPGMYIRELEWATEHYRITLKRDVCIDTKSGQEKCKGQSYYYLYSKEYLQQRRVEIAEAQAAFIEDPRSNVTCGFELETQSTEGYDYKNAREYEDGDIDESIIKGWNLPPDVEVIDDESVEGFEFRTVGGHTPTKFKELITDIFGLSHTIDYRCSFHIHLRVKGIKHLYSQALRQSMIEYLFENCDRIPESVLERWSDDDANHFFLPDDSEAKYNFINFHQFGTIEFRCFGNIRTVADAMTCLELAIESLQYAYKVRDRVAPITTGDWNDTARRCMESGKDQLRNFVKAHRDQMNVAIHNENVMKIINSQLELIKPIKLVIGE